MGLKIKIEIPGHIPDNFLTKNQPKEIPRMPELAKSSFDIDYSSFEQFIKAIILLTKGKETENIKYFIEVLNKPWFQGLELSLSFQEGLTLLKGLNEIKEIGITNLNSQRLQKIFNEIEELLQEFINLRNQKAILSFS